MMLSKDKLERRLQLAGILLLVGTITEIVCVFWTKPIAFLVFVGVGGVTLIAGIAFYLLSVLGRHHPES
jgi:hypothetical protein